MKAPKHAQAPQKPSTLRHPQTPGILSGVSVFWFLLGLCRFQSFRLQHVLFVFGLSGFRAPSFVQRVLLYV